MSNSQEVFRNFLPKTGKIFLAYNVRMVYDRTQEVVTWTLDTIWYGFALNEE